MSIFGHFPELDGANPIEQEFPKVAFQDELDRIKRVYKAKQQVAVLKFKLELMKLDYPYEGKTARQVVREIIKESEKVLKIK